MSVGDYVAARLGDAVVDRLVEPLLGGVYAGQARLLSLRACLPQVFDGGASRRVPDRCRRQRRPRPRSRRPTSSAPSPVFAGLDGGVGRLAEVLTESLRARGVTIRSETIVRELHREPDTAGGGWSVVVGPQPRPERLRADAVVLATPAAPRAGCSLRTCPTRRGPCARSTTPRWRSSPSRWVPMARQTLPLRGSGFLVPAGRGAHDQGEHVLVDEVGVDRRGRWRPVLPAGVRGPATARPPTCSDPTTSWSAIAVAEVSEALGHQLPRIVDTHVQRWGGALPQYTVGHVDRVARIRADTAAAPGLELAGAAYEGVGIPACIASGRSAARARGRPTCGRASAGAGG